MDVEIVILGLGCSGMRLGRGVLDTMSEYYFLKLNNFMNIVGCSFQWSVDDDKGY